MQQGHEVTPRVQELEGGAPIADRGLMHSVDPGEETYTSACDRRLGAKTEERQSRVKKRISLRKRGRAPARRPARRRVGRRARARATTM